MGRKAASADRASAAVRATRGVIAPARAGRMPRDTPRRCDGARAQGSRSSDSGTGQGRPRLEAHPELRSGHVHASGFDGVQSLPLEHDLPQTRCAGLLSAPLNLCCRDGMGCPVASPLWKSPPILGSAFGARPCPPGCRFHYHERSDDDLRGAGCLDCRPPGRRRR